MTKLSVLTGGGMASKQDRDRHDQSAYEAAIMRKTKKELEENFERYKRNVQVTMPQENETPSDFPGCVE